MNSHEAKKLNLPEIMARLGYHPIKTAKNGIELWYQSPFRPEKAASFHTSYLGGKWIWNDFGDSGGTVIDFIMRHENYYTVSEALGYLDKLYGRVGESLKNASFSFQEQAQLEKMQSGTSELQFIEAKKIINPLIISYLTEERKINKEVVFKYLKEIRYKNLNNNKEYFAFGMENRAGGYEIRSASDKLVFKSALKCKDITLVEGFKSGNGVVNIFEGMTDFLSLLTIMKTNQLSGDSIIMHSLSSYGKTKSILEQNKYSSINSFLDNNRSGREHLTKLQTDFGSIVTSQSELFLPYVDINEMLVKM